MKPFICKLLYYLNSWRSYVKKQTESFYLVAFTKEESRELKGGINSCFSRIFLC
jgi:hypothetical protein